MSLENSELLRAAQLMITDEIVRICNKYNINYFLDSGSMLGAVRHKGFIPWDDDMDIGMRKSDYEYFTKIAPDELGNNFFLDNYSTNQDNGLVFSKIRLKNTIYIEDKGNPSSIHNEVFVDVFPYYYVSDIELFRKAEAFEMSFLAQALMSKSGYKVWKGDGIIKRFKFIPSDVVGFVFSKKRLHAWVTHLINKHSNTKRIAEQGGSGYNRWYFPASIFDELITVDFEDRKYKIPKKYDEYLKIAYGNYLEIPPLDKRTTHRIQKLDVEAYKNCFQSHTDK